VSGEQLAQSQATYGVALMGPVRPDVSWQARAPDGYATPRFLIDWDAQRVICPQGKVNCYWRPQRGVRDNPVIEVQFRQADCGSCAARAQCTRSKTGPRTPTLMPREHFLALQSARERQQTEAFRQLYHKRAGI